MQKLILFFAILSVSCASCLVPDQNPPAIDSRYPTLEWVTNKTFYLGTGIEAIRIGDDVGTLGLSFQGYYDGTARIFSRECNLDQTIIYSKSQKVSIPLSGQALHSCLISVAMSPTYPTQKNQAEVVYGFEGHFALKVIEPKDHWFGFRKVLTGDWSDSVHLPVDEDGDLEYFTSGCSITHHGVAKADGGVITIGLNQSVKKEVGLCVMEGAVFQKDHPDVVFTVIVSQYKSNYVPLAIPDVDISGDKITVVGPAETSFVGMDSIFKNDRKSTFTFDINSRHVIRLLTVKGRSNLGIYNGETGEWRWVQ